MIYAYKKGSSDWRKHDTYSVWSLEVNESGVDTTDLDLKDLLRNDEYETHGLAMWSAWFIGGFLLVVTKRHTKKHWHVMHYLHALIGYIVLAVTII